MFTWNRFSENWAIYCFSFTLVQKYKHKSLQILTGMTPEKEERWHFQLKLCIYFN